MVVPSCLAKLCPAVCLFAFMLSTSLDAQEISSSPSEHSVVQRITGTVTAKGDGSPVDGARVLAITSTGKELEATADQEGHFALNTSAGEAVVQVRIRALGFATLERALESEELKHSALDFTLDVDPLQQSITVFSDAPLLQTSPQITRTIDAKTLTELPSSNRNLAQFTMLDPRARNTVGSGSDGRQQTRLTINNQSFRFTQYELDGSTNFDFIFSNGPQQAVSVSAVGEFKLLANQFSAQYGRSSGGIVLVSTKAGSDQFHGEAFAFVRPSGLQSAPPVSTIRVPNEKEQWGSTVGGPILRGRTNFLANYEQLHQLRGSYIQSPAPGFFTGKLDSWIGLTRIDHKWNEKQFTTLRFNGDYLTTNNFNDIIGGYVQPSAGRNDVQQSMSGQITQRSFFANWLNDFRFSYANAIPLYNKPFSPSIRIVRPSYSTTGLSAYESVRTQTWQVADAVYKNWKNHSFTFGGDYIRQYTNNNYISTTYGTYTFASGASPTSTTPIQYTQTVGVSFLKYGQDLVSAFVEDDWKVLPRLTANLGVRYDFQSITAGLTNFAPRLGASYDLFGTGKTILHTGAGLFYDEVYGQLQRNTLNLGPDSTTASYTVSNPSYPAPPALGAADKRDLYLLDPQLRNPYTMEASFGLQQQLPAGWVLSVDALYMASRHQLRLNLLNAPTPFIRTAAGQTRSTTAANATRQCTFSAATFNQTGNCLVYQGIAVNNVEQVESSGTSRNTSGEVQLTRRFSRFQLQGSYLYSSMITNTFFTGGISTGTPGDWGVTSGESGPSDYFQRHRFVASGIVDLPWAFRFSGNTVVASGLPVNPLTGVDNNGDGILADRPAGMSRNSFHSPVQTSVDLSLARSFQLVERLRLETRVEGFNVLNHSNYVGLSGTYGNGTAAGSKFLTPTAGIQNSDPARQLQFGVRLLF